MWLLSWKGMGLLKIVRMLDMFCSPEMHSRGVNALKFCCATL